MNMQHSNLNDQNEIVPMDYTCETIKRKLNCVDGVNSKDDNPVSSKKPNFELNSVNTINSNLSMTHNLDSRYVLMKIELFNDDNFQKISWELFKLFLDQISNSWKFVSFINDHKSCLIKEHNQIKIDEFLVIDSIAIQNNLSINIKFSVARDVVRGIVYNKFTIPLDIETIKTCLLSQGVEDVFKLSKIDKDGLSFYTGSLILSFQHEIKPKIELFDVLLKVERLDPRPMICMHCGMLGHTKKKCKTIDTEYCKKCFKVHDLQETCVIQCKNCNEFHLSTDKRCELLVKEVEILKFKQTYVTSYDDAKTAIEEKCKVVVNNNVASKNVKDLLEKINLKDVEIENLKTSTKIAFDKLRKARESEAQKNNEIIELQKINEEITIENEKLVCNLRIADLKITKFGEEINECKLKSDEEKFKLTEENNNLKIDFGRQLEQYSDEIKEVSEQNIKTAKELNNLKGKIEEQKRQISVGGERSDKIKEGFNEFVKFSDSTIIEYKKFLIKKGKDVRYDIFPEVIRTRGNSLERKTITK